MWEYGKEIVYAGVWERDGKRPKEESV